MGDLPLKVVETADSQLGSPYVFGAWGEFCTPTQRKKRVRDDHPNTKNLCQVLNGKASSCEGCKWNGDRMFDCRGFTDWCLRQVDIDLYGDTCTTQYSTKSNWIERGDIAEMPEAVCCVFVADGNRKAHTGLYVGNGKIIHCSGEVKTGTLNDRSWTHYAIPAGLYTAEEIAKLRELYPKPKRTIKKGDTGETVKTAQRLLNEHGYDCGKVDGIFGANTKAAVVRFQQDNGLVPDGVIGPLTWAALEGEYKQDVVYMVMVDGLTKRQADELLAIYPNAFMVAKGAEG